MRSRYADLSGLGGATYPGRWNHAGEPALYTSLHAAVALLEILVHIDRALIPDNYCHMQLELDLQGCEIEILPKPKPARQLQMRKNAARVGVLRSLHAANDWWATKRGPSPRNFSTRFALFVPSVVVPDFNVILFPNAPGFTGHLRLISVEPFTFDSRLFAPISAMGAASQ